MVIHKKLSEKTEIVRLSCMAYAYLKDDDDVHIEAITSSSPKKFKKLKDKFIELYKPLSRKIIFTLDRMDYEEIVVVEKKTQYTKFNSDSEVHIFKHKKT